MKFDPQIPDTTLMLTTTDYDDHVKALGYKGAEWAVDYLLKLNLDPSIRILDVAAGTGLIGCFSTDDQKCVSSCQT